jgi:MGT family glycosyltransferase
VTDRPDWLPDQDTPLIYMTFGTVTANEGRSRQIFDASVKAVADLPITVLVTTGKDAPPDLIENVPDNVVVRDFVDQAEVLAFAEVMVCHGGSGTVLGGLEAGVPMIIVPMFADQPDNARCLEAVGLSTTIHEHEVEVLGAKILDILGDPKRKRAAKEAADNFAKLPTLADAVRELVAD